MIAGSGNTVAGAAVDARVHIEIWSDVVCPWGDLGQHRFERALEQLGWDPDDPASGVTVRWRAFELDPRAPHLNPGSPEFRI